jgi:hypothetical protein
MTIDFLTSTVINRQQSEVWNFIANFDNSPMWMPDVDSAIHLDDGELGRGSTLRFELAGEIQDQRVSYWESGKSFTLSSEQYGSTSERTYKLKPETVTHPVETVVDLHIKMKLQGVQLLLAPLTIWSTKRIANKQLATIKKLLELDFNAPLTNSPADI